MSIPKAYSSTSTEPASKKGGNENYWLKIICSLFRSHSVGHLKSQFVSLTLTLIIIGGAVRSYDTAKKYLFPASSIIIQKSDPIKKPLFSLSIGKKSLAASPVTPAETLKDVVQSKQDTSSANNSSQPSEKKESSNSSAFKFDPLALSSENEIKLLQTLSSHRQELDKREADISKKELFLKTFEKQLQDKMATLNKIKADIDTYLKTSDKQEKEKLTNLVKIYEGMKPKDAARIFNELDIKILKEIAGAMNQKKLSLILGIMTVSKAKELTILLAVDKNPFAQIDSKKS